MKDIHKQFKMVKMIKTRDSRFLKNYTLVYTNKGGSEKRYEIVSRNDMKTKEELGTCSNGVTVIAVHDHRLLLLKEFRMGVNRYIINQVAGMLEPGETIEECARRELYEETGLKISRIIEILPSAFEAVAIADTRTNTVFAEVEGELSDHTSVNEDIIPGFYTKDQIKELLKTEEFSARTQLLCHLFCYGFHV